MWSYPDAGRCASSAFPPLRPRMPPHPPHPRSLALTCCPRPPFRTRSGCSASTGVSWSRMKKERRARPSPGPDCSSERSDGADAANAPGTRAAGAAAAAACCCSTAIAAAGACGALPTAGEGARGEGGGGMARELAPPTDGARVLLPLPAAERVTGPPAPPSCCCCWASVCPCRARLLSSPVLRSNLAAAGENICSTPGPGRQPVSGGGVLRPEDAHLLTGVVSGHLPNHAASSSSSSTRRGCPQQQADAGGWALGWQAAALCRQPPLQRAWTCHSWSHRPCTLPQPGPGRTAEGRGARRMGGRTGGRAFSCQLGDDRNWGVAGQWVGRQGGPSGCRSYGGCLSGGAGGGLIFCGCPTCTPAPTPPAAATPARPRYYPPHSPTRTCTRTASCCSTLSPPTSRPGENSTSSIASTAAVAALSRPAHFSR